MSRPPLFIWGLLFLAANLQACGDVPESVIRRNAAQQGSLSWDSGFAPLPPLSDSGTTAETPPQTQSGFSELPPLPFPALSPLPTPSPLELETPPAATASPAPESSPQTSLDSGS